MIIQSIRLKNVKSYGEGADGTGVTVYFQGGVNRIAGPNGNGKSTLIESLGYALFLAAPSFEENFKTETYLLRHGSKAGEIAVTFSLEGETYRLERGIGSQNKLRTKVVQTRDGSICAEGDVEVEAFLWRLLGLGSSRRLRELFSSVIGVKQGRLALPFDSKPSSAKSFFEPLLDVDIFRRCFDGLKPARDRFEQQHEELRNSRATVEERIRERADSPEMLAGAQQRVAELIVGLAAAAEARDASRKERDAREAQQKAVDAARAARQEAAAARSAATERRKEAETRLAESERAMATARDSKPAHDAFRAAEEALKGLRERIKERDQLQTKRTEAEKKAAECRVRAKSSRDQAFELQEQMAQKGAALDGLKGTVEALRRELEAGSLEHEEVQRSARAAESHRGEVKAWVNGLPALSNSLQKLAAKIAALDGELSAWDPARLETARAEEGRTSEALKTSRELRAKAIERRETLARQLKQIGDGLCPLLGETCRQFEPAKVQTDLSALDLEVEALEEQVAVQNKAHSEAQRTLTELTRAETQISGKGTQLDQEVKRWSELTAIDLRLSEAVEGLRRWHEGIPPPPVVAAPEIVPARALEAMDTFKSFVGVTEAWWSEASSLIDERLRRAREEQTTRAGRQGKLETHSSQLAGLKDEVEGLEARAARVTRDAAGFEEQAVQLETVVREREAALKGYEGLDAEMDQQTSVCEGSRAGYESYLQARGLAEELEPRREELTRTQEREARAMAELEAKELDLTRASAAHDPERLSAAREDYEKKLGAANAVEANLAHARTDLGRQEKRAAEWKEACAEQAKIDESIRRCEAATRLADLARKTLRDAAPAVAQHLCDRIAERAQLIFNQINPDPVELAWKAESYSLRVAPADRRFAMLSGGEQTKLALSMTLAMVQEFSTLRFCIFDEPTYGVDAESRRKLADAILAAQQAAGLEQLLLVSHDDAFDGKIEHSIVLKKSALHGTVVEEA